MYQTEWSENIVIPHEVIPFTPSAFSVTGFDKILNLKWEEHCVECAVPECYGSCNLYVKRKDGACARFVNGISTNKTFTGRFDFGADISFRKWAKLEADLKLAIPNSLSESEINSFQSLSRKEKLSFRNSVTEGLTFTKSHYDLFIVECYSPENDQFNLILEYFLEIDRIRTTKFRKSFIINKGRNHFTVPFIDFMMDKLEGYVCLYPEGNEHERRLIFTWLDFVSLRNESNKVKCVAWDLDNTVWSGIISEDNEVTLRQDVVDMIKAFDERGIIQSIVSKNDFEFAYQKLRDFEIDKYFLYPAINWGQKSENIKSIASQLNIGIDAIAVVDDSAFERSEIIEALPSVRVYSEKQVDELLSYPEFDVPITSLSRKRRETYQTEQLREVLKKDITGTYDDFLRSCEMQVRVYIPKDESDIIRCWELMQRSNQLNLSTKRYTKQEFDELLSATDTLSVAIHCNDKFGDYGIVGFASLKFMKLYPVLIDFALSCRVAQKKVEHAFLQELTLLLTQHRYQKITAKFIETAKNKPLRQVFDDLPFQLVDDSQEATYLRLDFNQMPPSSNIMATSFDVGVNDFLKLLPSPKS